jgi:hypothetical protein
MGSQQPQIPEGLLGQPLAAVRVLMVDYSDEPGRPCREAISLDFSSGSIVMEAITETSELDVRTGAFVWDDDAESGVQYAVVDVTDQPPFLRFRGRLLRNWWAMRNERGYDDGLTVAFEANAGLCFVAMNNEVSVLTVSGEQMS